MSRRCFNLWRRFNPNRRVTQAKRNGKSGKIGETYLITLSGQGQLRPALELQLAHGRVPDPVLGFQQLIAETLTVEPMTRAIGVSKRTGLFFVHGAGFVTVREGPPDQFAAFVSSRFP